MSMQTHTFPTLDEHYAAALGLVSPWNIKSVDLDIKGAALTIEVTYATKEGLCPDCGVACPVEDLREERSWRHLDMMQFATTIVARVPRIRCKKHQIKTIATPWAGPRSHFTLLFERFAIEVLLATSSITKGTTLLRISWHQAQLLMERAVLRGMVRREKEDCEIAYVGIDEKSFLKGHQYASLATDIKKGRVLDVEEGRKKENAITLLNRAISEKQRATVKAGSMDMWEPFMKAWQEVVGYDAPIVHDKFHVAGYIGKAVDKVRKGEHKTLLADGHNTLTKTKYLWLKNPDNWNEEEKKQFENLIEDGLKVGRAWALKEAFRKFWEYRREWSALRFFKWWYFRATHSRLKPIIEAAKTLKRHIEGLLSYSAHQITNAATEGLNSKIQNIKASARGFRNFANYRVAILFHCGKLNMLP